MSSLFTVEVLRCVDCGRFCVAINGLRVSNHSCSGAWATASVEQVRAENFDGSGLVAEQATRLASKVTL